MGNEIAHLRRVAANLQLPALARWRQTAQGQRNCPSAQGRTETAQFPFFGMAASEAAIQEINLVSKVALKLHCFFFHGCFGGRIGNEIVQVHQVALKLHSAFWENGCLGGRVKRN